MGIAIETTKAVGSVSWVDGLKWAWVDLAALLTTRSARQLSQSVRRQQL